jgi:tetratricopeptide (TPR) repeat protein
LKKLLIAPLLLFSLITPNGESFAKPAQFEKEIEQRVKCPNSFLENPPRYFYCIYRDYHSHKYDEGIKKAEAALKEVMPLYKKNPEAKLPNYSQKEGKLKDPRVKRAVSDLHMLLGMLYYKKSLNGDDKEVKKVYREFYEKLNKKGFDFVQVNELLDLYTMKTLFPEGFNEERKKRYEELLSKMGLKEEELHDLVKRAKEASKKESEKKLAYLKKAVEELQRAIEIDPENALAYYQLGNLYSGALSETVPETSEAAAQAYYKAALLFKKQGDEAAYKEVVKKLKLVSPDSKYLKMLESNQNA